MEFVLGAVIVLAGLVLSVYTLYRLTLGKVKPKYPGVPPTGQPDIYTKLRVPRPIYEDMEQYPWLFGKKGQETARWTKRKLKKKR